MNTQTPTAGTGNKGLVPPTATRWKKNTTEGAGPPKLQNKRHSRGGERKPQTAVDKKRERQKQHAESQEQSNARQQLYNGALSLVHRRSRRDWSAHSTFCVHMTSQHPGSFRRENFRVTSKPRPQLRSNY